MRKEGYYWAKHKYMEDTEVVQITGNGQAVWRNSLDTRYNLSDFTWIDDEPIPAKKMPVNLKVDHYYVIKKKCNIANKPFLAKYTNFNIFIGNTERHHIPEVEIISGPFSIEQLTNLKPC